VHTLFWALVGGLVCGLLEGLFQNLFGLTPPIVEGGPDALRDEIARHKHGLLESKLLAATAEESTELAASPAGPDEDAQDGGRP